MKKQQKAERELEQLRAYLQQAEFTVSHTRDRNLWSHEAAIRKRIRFLRGLADKKLKDFSEVQEGFLRLFDDISGRLLADYNRRNGTDYVFDDIVSGDRRSYLSAGIMSLLITRHIPRVIAQAFSAYFPDNPKDEYERARNMRRRVVLHLGETNTGKTYQAIERLKQAQTGVYLAPLRILALENYERLNREGVPCNLVTGEEELLVDGARHVCSTVEKLNLDQRYGVAVIDEIQMIANSQRGQAWTRALLGLACEEIHVCGALNAKELAVKILKDCGDEYEVREYRRDTPLAVLNKPFTLRDAEKGDALVAFSKKQVLQLSKYYHDRGMRNSVIYGDLPPDVRRMQYRAFLSGENPVLITTDAIGMGVNLPIRRVIFMSLRKFDGEEFRMISSQEVKQIGGRAGRRGIYDVGYIGAASDEQDFLQDNLDTPDEQLDRAVVGPSEVITQIKGLPLKEKLALWSERPEELDYYRKMDVRDYLLILESVKHFKLPEDVEYQLMKIPFNINDELLMQCFLNFVEEAFVKKQAALARPKTVGRSLFDMERYYQKLDLYYSFSKNFHLAFDPEWVYAERDYAGERINRLLQKL